MGMANRIGANRIGANRIGLKTRLKQGVMVLALTLAAPAAWAETLADALADAYRNSGLLEQNRALLQAADEDVAIATAALRPILSWAADFTRTAGASGSDSAFAGRYFLTERNIDSTDVTVSLVASLLLYDGGRTKLQVDVAKETVLATREQLVGIEQNVLLTAVQAYMDVRSSSETVALRQNNIRVIREELRAARDRFEVGEVTRTDVATAEARLAAANANFVQAQGDLAIAIEDFRAAVGRKPGRLSPPPTYRNPAKSPDAAKGVAQRHHPAIKAQQHGVAANDIGVMIASSGASPEVNLVGRLSMVEGMDQRDFTKRGTIGIEASGPISRGGELASRRRKAIVQANASRAQLRQTSVEVAQAVGSSYARLEVARSAVVATQEQIRAARVAFRGVREEATLGARTTLDVLNAEQELLDAQASLITARAQEYVAGYALLSAMGLLTAEDLKLNVPQYDPTAYYNLVKDAPYPVSKQGAQLDKVLKSLNKK